MGARATTVTPQPQLPSSMAEVCSAHCVQVTVKTRDKQTRVGAGLCVAYTSSYPAPAFVSAECWILTPWELLRNAKTARAANDAELCLTDVTRVPCALVGLTAPDASFDLVLVRVERGGSCSSLDVRDLCTRPFIAPSRWPCIRSVFGVVAGSRGSAVALAHGVVASHPCSDVVACMCATPDFALGSVVIGVVSGDSRLHVDSSGRMAMPLGMVTATYGDTCYISDLWCLQGVVSPYRCATPAVRHVVLVAPPRGGAGEEGVPGCVGVFGSSAHTDGLAFATREAADAGAAWLRNKGYGARSAVPAALVPRSRIVPHMAAAPPLASAPRIYNYDAGAHVMLCSRASAVSTLDRCDTVQQLYGTVFDSADEAFDAALAVKVDNSDLTVDVVPAAAAVKPAHEYPAWLMRQSVSHARSECVEAAAAAWKVSPPLYAWVLNVLPARRVAWRLLPGCVAIVAETLVFQSRDHVEAARAMLVEHGFLVPPVRLAWVGVTSDGAPTFPPYDPPCVDTTAIFHDAPWTVSVPRECHLSVHLRRAPGYIRLVNAPFDRDVALFSCSHAAHAAWNATKQHDRWHVLEADDSTRPMAAKQQGRDSLR